MIILSDILKLRIKKQPPVSQVDAPSFIKSEQGQRFTVINDAIVRILTHTPEAAFYSQLKNARASNMSMILNNAAGERIGLAATTSTVKDDKLLNKNIIITPDLRVRWPGLAHQYIISAFILKDTLVNNTEDGSNVFVAGWLDSDDIDKYSEMYGRKIPAFVSELPVIALPCRHLRPPSELYKELGIQ